MPKSCAKAEPQLRGPRKNANRAFNDKPSNYLEAPRWTFTEFGSEQLITFVAMATPDDLNANAEFIRLADSFVEVPGGKNVNNYANVDLICKTLGIERDISFLQEPPQTKRAKHSEFQDC